MQPASSTTERSSSQAIPQRQTKRRRWWIVGYRRNLLVDPRGQLRTTLWTACAVGVLLVALLVSLHFARQAETAALGTQMPSLIATLEAQNRVALAFQITGAVVFLAMVVVVTLIETHKTAGAALSLRRHLDRIRDGEYGVRVRLRRGDNLQDVASSINEMSIARDERLWQEVQVLEDLAEQAKQISGSEDAARLIEVLVEQVAERRLVAGFPEPGSDES
jgi:methyl-accepting chemotaxis protein